MRIHILGICGTFMGSVALLARELGFEVTGSDKNFYPPMSTQLEAAGVKLYQGYDNPTFFKTLAPDLVIVGNVVRRGWPMIEYLLNSQIPFISGPQWLAENALRGRHVLAVAGTHGKTSTASMLAWILAESGLKPGFLIGGVPQNFGISTHLGAGDYFVIEADEYDTAFFDKRSKFVHYRPNTLIINNLEFDHADIFSSLAAIQRQFHHLVRTVPSTGLIIYPKGIKAITEVLAKGCWTPTVSTQLAQAAGVKINEAWGAIDVAPDGTRFNVLHAGKAVGNVVWSQIGLHHVSNALTAIAAAHHVGVDPQMAIAALNKFIGVKRRLEVCGRVNNITVYDDFAHHPTAIASLLKSLRAHLGADAKIIVAIEFNSYTMRSGYHQIPVLALSLKEANSVYCLKPDGGEWDVQLLGHSLDAEVALFDKPTQLMQALANEAQPGDHIVLMSNGSFAGIHKPLLNALTLKLKNKDTVL